MIEPRRILIADDELLARQRLARYLREFDAQLVLAEAANGLQAVAQIQSFAPHVVLLDIEMPGLNGFEVLQQFEQRPFQVIFQTAYDQFAIRAFEEHACGYLLKPFTAERLRQALSFALQRAADESRLAALARTLAQRDGSLQRLTVKQGNRLRILDVSEIQCFVSRDHYTLAYFGEPAHEAIVELSLARLSERLDPASFQSLHRANLVRLAAIKSLTNRDGQIFIELQNGMCLPVARSKRKLIKELLQLK